MKSQLTAYFLFCNEKRKEFFAQTGGKKKLKCRGNYGTTLSWKKKPYQDKYNENKKEYDTLVSKLKKLSENANKNVDEDNDKDITSDEAHKHAKQKRNRKVKVKSSDDYIRRNNSYSCNYASNECDECKKKKKREISKNNYKFIYYLF